MNSDFDDDMWISLLCPSWSRAWWPSALVALSLVGCAATGPQERDRQPAPAQPTTAAAKSMGKPTPKRKVPSASSAGSRTSESSTNTTRGRVGEATYYASYFEGHLTASGEPYDSQAMTAAHKTLPFGTKVKVTTLDTGNSAVVTINDRGPFVDGRIIDVSEKAAKQLGLIGQGAARVQLQVLGQ